jgi:hypothetical protein
MSRNVEIGGIVNKDSTRAGFETNNLAATAREIEACFLTTTFQLGGRSPYIRKACRLFFGITASQCTGMPLRSERLADD